MSTAPKLALVVFISFVTFPFAVCGEEQTTSEEQILAVKKVNELLHDDKTTLFFYSTSFGNWKEVGAEKRLALSDHLKNASSVIVVRRLPTQTKNKEEDDSPPHLAPPRIMPLYVIQSFPPGSDSKDGGFQFLFYKEFQELTVSMKDSKYTYSWRSEELAKNLIKWADEYTESRERR